MAAANQLINEIETLPPDYIQEVMTFIKYLKYKKMPCAPETMLLSERTLAKDWDTPEEDDLWANL